METNSSTGREFGSRVSSTGREAADKAKSVISDLSNKSSLGVDEIQSRAREYVESGENLVRQHPFYAVLGAAAVGVVVGLMMRSRD
jgi:ElaB/YqjD/DUF883 family membrane-anchored ribosome-binding protein